LSSKNVRTTEKEIKMKIKYAVNPMAAALSFLFTSGCYTQLATDDEDSSTISSPEPVIIVEEPVIYCPEPIFPPQSPVEIHTQVSVALKDAAGNQTSPHRDTGYRRDSMEGTRVPGSSTTETRPSRESNGQKNSPGGGQAAISTGAGSIRPGR
jgi:hypothetical protein